MKISVTGYNSFKAVIDELGGSPSQVFYIQFSSNVTDALAILPSGIYVEGDRINNTVANFVAEYSSAVEVVGRIKGEF